MFNLTSIFHLFSFVKPVSAELGYECFKLVKSPAAGLNPSLIQPLETPPVTGLFENISFRNLNSNLGIEVIFPASGLLKMIDLINRPFQKRPIMQFILPNTVALKPRASTVSSLL